MGQAPQGQPPAAPLAIPTAQAPAQPAPVQSQGTQPAPQRAVPDYPEPRTLTLGAFYWITGPGTEPSYYGGKQALDFETLKDWGRPHKSPGIEASMPISRTGELHFEYFRTKGDGNQDAPAALDIFTYPYPQGTYLATQYQLQNARLYLDDLLWPHKFPVSKFRVKSLWEAEWTQIKGSIDAPYIDFAGAATGVTSSVTASHQIIYPAFGLAAEYALTPHILLRAAATGFGIPHKAVIWDGEATVAYRLGMFEIRGGAKAFHFKTSPNSTEYAAATLTGAFVGLRWHWSL
jgi:hypothetical protein